MAATGESIAPAARGWLTMPERGNVFAIRALLLACKLFGRKGAHAWMWPFVVYYSLFGQAPRNSRAYLRRVFPKVTWPMVHRHVLTFAECSLDRAFFLRDEHHRFEVTTTGRHHLERLRDEKRGAILLGAHLGSFEAMRTLARDASLKLSVLVHFRNARKINSVLAAFAPEHQRGIIEIDPDDPRFVLEVAERIEAGESVAVLGDRVGLGERSTEVDFLGGRARFPVGPYALAAVLRCPLYLTFGLYHRPNRYDLYCEPMEERLELPRREREAALQAYAQRFAERLEHYCRLAPYAWFNFHPFWLEEDEPA